MSLAEQPFEQLLLNLFVERVVTGVVGVIGSGAEALQERGLQQAFGVEGRDYVSVQALSAPAASWDGVVVLDALRKVPRDAVPGVCRELARVVRPGGWLLLGFPAGLNTRNPEIAAQLVFHHRPAVAKGVRAAGFTIEDVLEREPTKTDPYPSRRGYILAQRTG